MAIISINAPSPKQGLPLSKALLKSSSLLQKSQSLPKLAIVISQVKATKSFPKQSQLTIIKSQASLRLPVGKQASLSSKLRYYQFLNNSTFKSPLAAFNRFFGQNSKQTATHIQIDKTSLPLLTPNVNNSAESLLTALILHIIKYESSYNSRITVEVWKTEFVKRENKNYVSTILLINGYVLVNYVNIGSDFNQLNYQIITDKTPVFHPSKF